MVIDDALRSAAYVALALSLGGCDEPVLPPEIVCTAQVVSGIHLTVLNELGQAAAEGALGIAVDGEFVDTLRVISADEMQGVDERPGSYDITVAKIGYVSWSTMGVIVTADECHVIPVHLDVGLEKR